MFRSRLLWAVTAAASLGVLAIPAGAPASAQTTGTPFDRPDVFCEKRAPLPGVRNSSFPGVTPNSIVIADSSSDTDALKKLGVDLLSFHGTQQVYVDAINACGGINGRKIIFKRRNVNSAVSDLVGHTQALCLKITEDDKAFMDVQQGGSALLTRCVGVQHKTMIESTYYSTRAEFRDSKGRVFSYHPSAEGVAGQAVAWGDQQGIFKGKKITVVGLAIDPTQTAIHQSLYVDALKKLGYDASLEMLPCTGATCTSGMGNAVRRMKLNGTDLVFISHTWTLTNVGPMMAEFERQQFKSKILSAAAIAVNNDASQATITAGAGSKGADWTANQMGWTSVGVDSSSEFRVGVKESPVARMCHNLYAKAMNQAPYKYNETDILTAGHWAVPRAACVKFRNIARALYSLGNNLTTERAVVALHNVKPDVSMLKGANESERDFAFYQWPRVNPVSVTTMELRYPCPQSAFVRTCFYPTSRPPRWFPVKVS